VIERDGSVSRELFVLCAERGLLSLPRCTRCHEFLGWSLDRSLGDACVTCTGGGGAPWTAADPSALPIQEVMEDAVCVRADVPADALESAYVDLDLHATPVLEVDDSVLGIITRSDLMRRRCSTSDARDVMTAPAIMVSPTTPVKDAIELLGRHDIGRLPVIHPVFGLVGMVNAASLLQTLGHRGPS
jgi:CBS domain-containing protein